MQAFGKPFDAILFDLGGVLIELAGVERMLEWCPELGTTEELWRRWLHSPAVRRYETGGATDAEFAREVVREFDLPVAPAQFLGAFEHWPRALYPGVSELLAGLAPRYRLASVSNTNPLHWGRFCREWALDACFHANFPSHVVGRLKPDADYFDHVVSALGFARERILFVDDNRINVGAAANLGLRARQVPNFAALKVTLAECGIVAELGSDP
jgi:putative hydrolase of the HAD superfamily